MIIIHDVIVLIFQRFSPYLARTGISLWDWTSPTNAEVYFSLVRRKIFTVNKRTGTMCENVFCLFVTSACLPGAASWWAATEKAWPFPTSPLDIMCDPFRLLQTSPNQRLSTLLCGSAFMALAWWFISIQCSADKQLVKPGKTSFFSLRLSGRKIIGTTEWDF